jgi:hypothetical protein
MPGRQTEKYERGHPASYALSDPRQDRCGPRSTRQKAIEFTQAPNSERFA